MGRNVVIKQGDYLVAKSMGRIYRVYQCSAVDNGVVYYKDTLTNKKAHFTSSTKSSDSETVAVNPIDEITTYHHLTPKEYEKFRIKNKTLNDFSLALEELNAVNKSMLIMMNQTNAMPSKTIDLLPSITERIKSFTIDIKKTYGR